jgi:hypothetical protein
MVIIQPTFKKSAVSYKNRRKMRKRSKKGLSASHKLVYLVNIKRQLLFLLLCTKNYTPTFRRFLIANTKFWRSSGEQYKRKAT